MLRLNEEPIGSTTGASGVACCIASAVLEMDGFAPLLLSIRNRGDSYDVAAFAADVARRIDRELRDIEELKAKGL